MKITGKLVKMYESIFHATPYIFNFIHHSHNMVAQANKTSKNTTNEIEKNDNSFHYI